MTIKQRVAERQLILEQYLEGTLALVEMIEMTIRTIEPEDLRQFFLTQPVEFATKLGLPLETTENDRKLEMQQFAARLMNLTAGLLAETFDGFVPSITSASDGTLMIIEQDLTSEEHRQFPNTVPTKTHVIKGN